MEVRSAFGRCGPQWVAAACGGVAAHPVFVAHGIGAANVGRCCPRRCRNHVVMGSPGSMGSPQPMWARPMGAAEPTWSLRSLRSPGCVAAYDARESAAFDIAKADGPRRTLRAWGPQGPQGPMRVAATHRRPCEPDVAEVVRRSRRTSPGPGMRCGVELGASGLARCACSRARSPMARQRLWG